MVTLPKWLQEQLTTGVQQCELTGLRVAGDSLVIKFKVLKNGEDGSLFISPKELERTLKTLGIPMELVMESESIGGMIEKLFKWLKEDESRKNVLIKYSDDGYARKIVKDVLDGAEMTL